MVSGTTDRDTFWVNNAGTWVEFKDFEYFEVRKKQNQMSEFEVKVYDIQDSQKLYFKEQAEIIFFVGTTKVLKGRIQTIEFASEYECTAKGYGMEVKLLDKDLIRSSGGGTGGTLNNGLQRYYKLDETSGTTVIDSMGQYNATNVGFDIGEDGKLNTAYYGDGSDIRYANIGLNTPVNGTVSFWLNVQSFNGIATGAVRLGFNAGTNNWNIMRIGFKKGTTRGIPHFSFYDGSDITCEGTETLYTSTWYHFVATWGSQGMKLYVNNSLIDSDAYTGNGNGDQPMMIGTIQSTQAVYFPDAYIDEVAVWNRQLDTTEISALYNSGNALAYPFPTSGTGSKDKRVQYDNISAQTIAKQILSVNTDGVAPWIINPGTDGLFVTDYGLLTARYEYANRLNAIGLLCNAIDYEWESYQTGTNYENDYLRIKTLLGNQTSVKTFNIAGANANCTRTERNIDLNNLVNYVDVLGYGDGINQIETTTYNASTTYSLLSADITATATTIGLVDASAFPSSGTIRIAKEIITYTGKSVNNLTGCTRGTSSTTAKSHKKNVYTERYFAKTTPQAGSSIAVYGLMDYTMIDRTILDEDTLELIASGYLLERMTPIISIKILSSEPMTDASLLTIGDKITVIDAESGLNGEYRIVGLKYIDNYGDISLEIEVSNRSLEFIEQMNKAREDQQNMGKYMQGATNIYAITETTEGDATHYIDVRFYMPEKVTALNRVLLNFKMKPVKTLKVLRTQAHVGFSESNIDTTFQDVNGAVLTVTVGANDTVLVMASGYSYSEEDGSTGMDIRFTRNGTVISQSEQRSRQDPGVCSFVYMPYARILYDQPGAGTWTYRVQAQSEEGTEDIRSSHFDILVFQPGFEEGSLVNPSVGVYVGEDGGSMTLKGTYNSDQSNIDITDLCASIGVNKWIDMQFRPNQEMRIESNAYVQMFLESVT